MTNSEIEKAFHEAQWKFAKSMPQWPHHYTLKETWSQQLQFTEIAIYITENGINEWWHYTWKGEKRKKPRIYFYLGKYKYWVMDKNPKDAVLINRAEVD